MRWAACLIVLGFYAHEARRRDQVAATTPVVVMRDGAALDGCRIAYASGLVLGSGQRQVRRDCPGAVLVEYEEQAYRTAAEQMWQGCLTHTPYLQPDGFHQVFLGLPTPDRRPPRAELAELVRTASAHGFAAAAGLGANKLVAGAAARVQRDALLGKGPRTASKAGTASPAVVAPGDEAAFLASLPLRYLWTVPEPIRRRLHELGLRSIGELRQVPEAELARQFGAATGRQLQRLSQGVDPDPVRPEWPPQTLPVRLVFAAPIAPGAQLESAVRRLAADLAVRLQRRDETCQHAALTLEPAEGKPLLAERTFSKPQNSAFYLEQSLLALLQRALAGQVTAVTALEASLSQLTPVQRHQASLLDDLAAAGQEEPVPRAAAPDPEKAARLEVTVAALRERFPARLLGMGQAGATSRREAMLSHYDPYRWNLAGEAKAPWPGLSGAR